MAESIDNMEVDLAVEEKSRCGTLFRAIRPGKDCYHSDAGFLGVQIEREDWNKTNKLTQKRLINRIIDPEHPSSTSKLNPCCQRTSRKKALKATFQTASSPILRLSYSKEADSQNFYET
eukprot:scaffold1707_cov88-Cylindrotheca_fusiformis.AAC.5